MTYSEKKALKSEKFKLIYNFLKEELRADNYKYVKVIDLLAIVYFKFLKNNYSFNHYKVYRYLLRICYDINNKGRIYNYKGVLVFFGYSWISDDGYLLKTQMILSLTERYSPYVSKTLDPIEIDIYKLILSVNSKNKKKPYYELDYEFYQEKLQGIKYITSESEMGKDLEVEEVEDEFDEEDDIDLTPVENMKYIELNFDPDIEDDDKAIYTVSKNLNVFNEKPYYEDEDDYFYYVEFSGDDLDK